MPWQCDQAVVNKLIIACQYTYRKLVLDDDSIAYHEVNNRVTGALMDAMGEDFFHWANVEQDRVDSNEPCDP